MTLVDLWETLSMALIMKMGSIMSETGLKQLILAKNAPTLGFLKPRVLEPKKYLPYLYHNSEGLHTTYFIV